MHNFKITIEYDGAGFSGWQLQRGRRTVQGVLENALGILNSGNPVRVHGAGRTDAGVHASGQVANFSVDTEWPTPRLLQAINGNLPEDVRVYACEPARADFHARYSARSRTYRYHCRLSESVLDRRTVWVITPPIHLYGLRQCARMILGDHDFTSFSKGSRETGNRPARSRQRRAGGPAGSRQRMAGRRCIVFQSQWIKRGDFVTFVITANRFLHHMIRYLVGTMMDVSRGKLTQADFRTILDGKNREVGVSKAPPQGLILEKVTY